MMKYLLSIFLLFFLYNPAHCQLDELWIQHDRDLASFIEGNLMYSQYLDGRLWLVEQKIKFAKNGKFRIQDWDWKIKRKSKGYEGQKWYKGKYQLKGDTIFLFWQKDTSLLVKSKYESILDHNVNSHGLKIDLPYASSIKRPDFSGDLILEIYIGFDALVKEKIVIDKKEIKLKEDFTSIIQHYKDSADSWQRIHAILFCDKNVRIEKLRFIEEELNNNDIRRMLYVTKYGELKPYDVDIRGIFITIIRNDIIVVPD